MAARIEMNQCMGCGNCLAACPRGLLRLTGAEWTNSRGVRYAQLSSPDACMDCGTCELMCTAGAIRADRSPAVSGYDLIRKDKVPPHAGCYLGTLSKVLADEIVRLGIQQDAVIFEKTGSAPEATLILCRYLPHPADPEPFPAGSARRAANLPAR